MNSSTTLDNEQQHSLTSASSLLLTSTLERYGNTLSADHRAALHSLCATLTDFATGKVKGRKVFALSTGLGKTSAIIAWLTSLSKISTDLAVAVSASQVEALCSIKRALIANGVPEKLIGLKHSLSNASLPSTGDEDRRFMLVTHERVRGGTNQSLFCEHKGQPRALLIYDESLFRSDAMAISERTLSSCLSYSATWVRGRKGFDGVLSYLGQVRDMVAKAVEQSRESSRVTGAEPGAAHEVTLPALSEEERAEYVKVMPSLAGKNRDGHDLLLEVIRLSGSSLRVALTPQGEGILWHRIAVPEELDNVLVLDASYPIRQLCKLDPTLLPANRFSDRTVKRFDNVTINQMWVHSGRNTVEKSFRSRKEDRTISREVVEVVKNIPRDESVLIFTFKSDRNRIAGTLLLDLREAGIDVEARMPDGKDRIRVVTWGNETSSNEFVRCQHVILAGVLHRSHLDIASAIIGQLDNKQAKIESEWLLELVESEVTHCIFQALSRGSCREVERGQAKPMTAYVVHPRPLKPLLDPVMPGAKYETWGKERPISQGVGRVARTEIALLEFLKGLPLDVSKISSRDVKRTMGITAEHEDSFKRAARKLTAADGWTREERSLVRVNHHERDSRPIRAVATHQEAS